MLLLPSLLCLALFPPCSTTSDKNELVDAAVKALTDASRESVDFFMALSSLGTQAAGLMKAIIPIGGIVYETANPKSESEECKALMDLRNRTQEARNLIQANVDIGAGVFETTTIMAQYVAKVYHPATVMMETTNSYLSPQYHKSDEFINGFKTACDIGDTAPRVILEYIRNRTVTSCVTPVTPREAQAMADRRASLMRALLRLRVENDNFPDPGIYMSEFLAIHKQLLHKDVLNEDFAVFNREFSSYGEAISDFFEELRNRGSSENVENDEGDCLLRGLITETNFHHEYIQVFLLALRSQLIDLTYVAGICANVTCSGNSDCINRFTKQVVDDVVEIASYTSQWSNVSMASAWPSAHNTILKEHIERNALIIQDVDNYILKSLAASAHPQLLKTGLPNHVYNILIVRVDQQEHQTYVEDTSKYCSRSSGARGFDTVIERIPLNSASDDETTEFRRRMYFLMKNASDFNVTIQKEMNLIHAEDQLSSIAGTLKQKIGQQFLSEVDFHCWVILRQWTDFVISGCPTIDYASFSNNYVDLKSVFTFNYTNTGFRFPRRHCEEYRFFFFV